MNWASTSSVHTKLRRHSEFLQGFWAHMGVSSALKCLQGIQHNNHPYPEWACSRKRTGFVFHAGSTHSRSYLEKQTNKQTNIKNTFLTRNVKSKSAKQTILRIITVYVDCTWEKKKKNQINSCWTVSMAKKIISSPWHSQQEPRTVLKKLFEALGRKRRPLLTNNHPLITKHNILSYKQRTLAYQSALQGDHIQKYIHPV